MATWLVTGGAGFIGSHIAEELVRRREKVRILDNFVSGRLENIARVKKSVDIVRGDIRDPRDVRRAVRGVDFVLHQAALRSVVRSIEDPISTNDVNVGGTVTVLWESLRAGVKRVVYASSSSVYGLSKKYPQAVSDPVDPVSPYAAAKLAGEKYCRVFSETMGLSTVSLRYFNVFGPRQDAKSKYAVVIPIFMKAAFEGSPLPLEGDGRQSRDFAYIDNVVSANLLAAVRPGGHGRVFNVACGTTTSLLDYVSLLERLVGRKLPIRRLPARKGDVRKTFADIRATRKYLGYRPSVSFEKGVQKTWNIFIQQKGEWK